MRFLMMLSLVLAGRSFGLQDKPREKETAMPEDSFYRLKTKTLEEKDADLKEYAGKVTLVVNVASECGYTPQYTGLEKLHGELKGKGE